MKISSQRYTDSEIVENKITNEDYEVLVSPEFTIDGKIVQVVLDGHHSLAAAIKNGVEPEYIEADTSDHDAIGTEQNDPELFLEIVHMGNDWYNVETGKDIW